MNICNKGIQFNEKLRSSRVKAGSLFFWAADRSRLLSFYFFQNAHNNGGDMIGDASL